VKTFRDAVHGDLDFTDDELAVIDTGTFQRLRQIKQLGAACLVYPSATHTRFEHSLGACGVAKKMVAAIRRNCGAKSISADDERLIGIYALVHDITHIPFPEASFDWVYCSHVLEHVPEDRRALSELLRVLKPGGQAVILVPLKGESTDEDPTVTDPMRREERFGQFDHVRQYGLDFVDRLQEAGFEVRVLRQETLGLGEQELLRMGLHTPDVVFLCSKGIRNQG